MQLSSLFLRCLNIEYTKVENDASFATEAICDTLYVYFECSNGKIDWKNNLDFPVKKCTQACSFFCHRGFNRVWESAKEHISKYILDKRFKSIVVVGYSHGAALALLCYEYAYASRKDLRALMGYGFGCPRVLWGFKRKKARVIWNNFTVVRNIDDIVTHVPSAVFGYYHTGKLLKIGKRGLYSKIDAHRPENILRELRKC